MNGKLVVGLGIAAVVVGVAFLRVVGFAPERSSVAAPIAATGESGSVLITYGDSGFVPAVVVVNRGASIRILNASNRTALRIAPLLDPGKEATEFQGFDASKAVGRGQSFQVSLTAPGIWAYKNALAPSAVGVVIVNR